MAIQRHHAPYCIYWAVKQHPFEVCVVVTYARTNDNTQNAVTPLVLCKYDVDRVEGREVRRGGNEGRWRGGGGGCEKKKAESKLTNKKSNI